MTAGLERIDDLGDLVAAPQHRRDERLLGRDQRAVALTGDRLGREAARHVDAVEQLEHRERARVLGEHLREQRRAAAPGADDEAIHAHLRASAATLAQR